MDTHIFLNQVTTAVQNRELSLEAGEALKHWLTETEFETFVPGIIKLIETGQWQELDNAFYTRLTVGTGGIRGPIGVGPNTINIRTIGEAAQGLSKFIWDFGKVYAQNGVVIGYDARKFAKDFAELCAEIFAANNIPAYLFAHLCATPEVSFAVRHLGVTAGVMITASHNPRTDNGFKFYWSDGGQVVPPYDTKFMELVSSVTEIKKIPLIEAKQSGLVRMVGPEVDAAYFAKVTELSLISSRSANIVFSPMHGSGSTNVLPALRQSGFGVTVVPEQADPDEQFPTAIGDLINPEFPEVMQLAVKLAEKNHADIALVADPDADRIGLAAKQSGETTFKLFNGDEVGALLTHFILSQRQIKRTLPPRGLVIKTYVTTTLISDIAKSFNMEVKDDLLVGFKYIAEIIEKLEDKNDFIFAAEQSLGYLAGSFVRDKDAAIASLLLAELTSFLKDQGKTLGGYLDGLYNHYGYYKNSLHTLEVKGKSGKERTTAIMKHLRLKPPTLLGGLKVFDTIDRLDPALRSPDNYVPGKTGDQITFICSSDNKTRITVRPSGTEPVVKYYVQCYAPIEGQGLEVIKANIDSLAKQLETAIVSYTQ